MVRILYKNMSLYGIINKGQLRSNNKGHHGL